ncbi:hypothetical protein [Fibrobacter sp.]|uniref:hypothetical protein n=1 Tax=Fibrobacter sp. TaxID=35828 RepID=UPI00388FFA76
MSVEGKTIFDYTSDKKIINHFVEKFGFKTEKELKDFLKDAGQTANNNCLLEMAHLTNDSVLLDNVVKDQDKRSETICKDMRKSNNIIG